MTADVLMKKALRAVESAKLLLDDGDLDGACNRAYYAMFDAAKAALLMVVPDHDTAMAKTHGGLISAFSQDLVKTAVLPTEMGRTLNRAHEIRQIADYTGDQVSREQVESLVGQARHFVQMIDAQLNPLSSGTWHRDE